MRTELINLLTAYLMGWKSIRDCAEWLAGIDWDNSNLDSATVDLIGNIELLVTEVLEGMRPEAEFWQEAAKIVANETNSWYNQPTIIISPVVASSNDIIDDRAPERTKVLV